jgi:DNA-binding CsgD family transcriptional regulator/N-acetylneuraminic acid mutarotase
MAEHGEPLSNREIDVLELVATGATNRQIAQELVVSVNTVKVHLRNIYTKLGVESRTEATLIAIRDGLVVVPGVEVEAEAPTSQEGPAPEEPTPATPAAPPAETPAEALPPLPWPKRVALVLILLVVTVFSVVTWPRSGTAAGQLSDDTDNRVNGVVSVGVAGESTGWRALAPMTLARSRFALAVTPVGTLYAIAGETNGGITGAVERYDPAIDQWTPLPTSKPTRVSNVSAAAIDAWIYVPGGWTAEGQPTALVEAYNPADDTWKQVAPLPRPLSGYALVAYDGRLYVFGGKDDRGYVNATYIYDPRQDRWQEGRPMPSRRAYAAAATLGSGIYVIGGYDGEREQSSCELYHPQGDAWESCEPLTLGRGGLGLAGVADRLYAVGGGWSNTLWFSEEYNPSSATWTPFETPVSRQWRSLASASTFDRFYVAGGWNGDYLNGAWEYVVLSHKIFIP